MTYLVTAIVQDNREETMKVCARTEDTFQATDAILKELAKRAPTDDPRGSAPLELREQIVKETWAIHSLFIEEEIEHDRLPD